MHSDREKRYFWTFEAENENHHDLLSFHFGCFVVGCAPCSTGVDGGDRIRRRRLFRCLGNARGLDRWFGDDRLQRR